MLPAKASEICESMETIAEGLASEGGQRKGLSTWGAPGGSTEDDWSAGKWQVNRDSWVWSGGGGGRGGGGGWRALK